LILGVTPELAEMRWPEQCSLLAVDQSVVMARTVWPGNILSKRWAVCGDWMDLPLRKSSIAIVVGDGSMNCVKYPEGIRELAGKVRDVLRDDGLLLLRCFVQPNCQELPEEIFSDLSQSKIPSVNHFKLRLLMALQYSAEEGIAVNDVYDRWAARGIDEECLMARTGWERSAVKVLEYYKGQNAVHTFPTLGEFRSVLHEFFDEVAFSAPSYALGDRCLRFVLQPRSGVSR
jgi:SAM-dependent methyltransferase